MIDLDFLESLIRAIDESTIDTVEIERGGTRIRVSKSPPAVPVVQDALAEGRVANSNSGAAPVSASIEGADAGAPAPAAEGSGESSGSPSDDGRLEVPSPMVGTFYRAPAPDAPAYVQVGDRVDVGDTLCIIEAMKLMNELECEVSGTVAEVCVENADPVEYGQVLFKIEPV